MTNIEVLQNGYLIGASDQIIRIWNGETGKLVHDKKLSICQSIQLLKLDHDVLIRACRDRIEILNSTNLAQLKILSNLTISDVTLINNRSIAVLLDDFDRKLVIYDDVLNRVADKHIYVNTDNEDFGNNQTNHLFSLPCGVLTISSSTGVFKLWKAETGEYVKKFELKPRETFLTVDALNDGSFMSAVSNGKIKIWRLETIE